MTVETIPSDYPAIASSKHLSTAGETGQEKQKGEEKKEVVGEEKKEERKKARLKKTPTTNV